jgi:hypothetical protein
MGRLQRGIGQADAPARGYGVDVPAMSLKQQHEWDITPFYLVRIVPK